MLASMYDTFLCQQVSAKAYYSILQLLTCIYSIGLCPQVSAIEL